MNLQFHEDPLLRTLVEAPWTQYVVASSMVPLASGESVQARRLAILYSRTNPVKRRTGYFEITALLRRPRSSRAGTV